jgi:hypothetical protein
MQAKFIFAKNIEDLFDFPLSPFEGMRAANPVD